MAREVNQATVLILFLGLSWSTHKLRLAECLHCDHLKAPRENDKDHDLLFGGEDHCLTESASQLSAENHIRPVACKAQAFRLM